MATTNTRTKGRRLELKEARVWRDQGWTVEVRHPVKFVGPGRTVAVDYFDRYDFIALWPAGGVACLVQVSTESEGSHEEPLGFPPRSEHPDAVLTAPQSKYAPFTFCPGVFEVYVYYRHLKGKGYVADRRWWAR